MKPFLLVATRAEDKAADEEYASFLRFGGLEPHQLHRLRLEAAAADGMPDDVDLSAYSGILIGGSPFTSSDPEERKSEVQRRSEAWLGRLLDSVVAHDFPFLGACYGIGTLGRHQGGLIDRTYGEPISAVDILLTESGRADPLLAGIPERFAAFVGHKEACTKLPPGAVLLAASATCPVQMFRLRSNLYATQFHPELDEPGILTRIDTYRYAGYFPADEAGQVIARVSGTGVGAGGTGPQRILRNFVARYSA
jgi:GMP synthase (glutamine-hydrolysing)